MLQVVLLRRIETADKRSALLKVISACDACGDEIAIHQPSEEIWGLTLGVPYDYSLVGASYRQEQVNQALNGQGATTETASPAANATNGEASSAASTATSETTGSAETQAATEAAVAKSDALAAASADSQAEPGNESD